MDQYEKQDCDVEAAIVKVSKERKQTVKEGLFNHLNLMQKLLLLTVTLNE